MEAVCPVTCGSCDTYKGPLQIQTLSETQRRCNLLEVQRLGGECTTQDLVGICTSQCYVEGFGPWLELCGDSAEIEAELSTLPFVTRVFLQSVIAGSAACQPPDDPQDGGDMPAECWDADYTAARCCQGATGARCWNSERTFGRCCPQQAGGAGPSPAAAADEHNSVAYTVIFNGTELHGSAVFQNYMSNAIRQQPGRITTWNRCLPESSQTQAVIDSISSLQAVLFIMIAFSFVPGGIVVFIVREKEAHHNSKHQQMVSGTSIPAYW